MAANWKWYATTDGDHDEYCFESSTREEAIAAISRECGPFAVIEVCEAVMSQAKRYDGADFVPFIRQRNHERIELGPR